MKKIFLSLSAIALLAVGTVSCGSDDSSSPEPGPGPGPGPDPIEANGILTVNDEEFALDLTESYVYGVVNTAGQTVVRAYSLPVQGDTLTVTRWTIDSFSGEEASEAENFQTIEVYVPVNGQSVVAPHQAETLYLASAFVIAGGEEVDFGTLSQWGMQINTFVDGDGGSINYTSGLVGSNVEISAEYNGSLNGTYYYVPSASAKGVKASKDRSAKFDVSKAVLEKGKAELIKN